MDSPGHCAQYCTYTMMEQESLNIVGLVTVDKREVGGKSTNMERFAFEKLLDSLLAKGVNVVELVTDQHIQISSTMSKYVILIIIHVDLTTVYFSKCQEPSA